MEGRFDLFYVILFRAITRFIEHDLWPTGHNWPPKYTQEFMIPTWAYIRSRYSNFDIPTWSTSKRVPWNQLLDHELYHIS